MIVSYKLTMCSVLLRLSDDEHMKKETIWPVSLF